MPFFKSDLFSKPFISFFFIIVGSAVYVQEKAKLGNGWNIKQMTMAMAHDPI